MDDQRWGRDDLGGTCGVEVWDDWSHHTCRKPAKGWVLNRGTGERGRVCGVHLRPAIRNEEREREVRARRVEDRERESQETAAAVQVRGWLEDDLGLDARVIQTRRVGEMQVTLELETLAALVGMTKATMRSLEEARAGAAKWKEAT